MQPRQRRLLSLIPVVIMLTACGTSAGVPPASVTDRPSDASPTSVASSTVSQTDTAWGRIWDALPPGFPRYPGATPAEDAAARPSSAKYAVAGGNAEEIAGWLQAAMEGALFSTDVSGPLEDGTLTLDSVGVAGCRIQTTVAPLGGMTFVTVLYAADCPIG
jgi:hypothetical protein